MQGRHIELSGNHEVDATGVNNHGAIPGNVVIRNLATMDKPRLHPAGCQRGTGGAFANNGSVAGLVTLEAGATISF